MLLLNDVKTEDACFELAQMLSYTVSKPSPEITRRKALLRLIRDRLGLTTYRLAAEIGAGGEQTLFKSIRGEQVLPKISRDALVELGTNGPTIALAYRDLDLLEWTEVAEELFGDDDPRSVYVCTLRRMPLETSELMQDSIKNALSRESVRISYIFPAGGRAHASYEWWCKVLTNIKGYVMGFSTSAEETSDAGSRVALETFHYASNVILLEKCHDNQSIWSGFTAIPLTRGAHDRLRSASRQPQTPRAIWSRIDQDELDDLTRDITSLASRYPEIRPNAKVLPENKVQDALPYGGRDANDGSESPKHE